jgi:oxygen-dependent protoporphyrinogen oxidase
MLDSILPIPFSHPAAKNRFVLNPLTNDLTLMPSSPLSILKPHPEPHLLHGLLMSILREPFKPKKTGMEDESIDSLVRRRLGPGVADNMVSAMVHGIYATDSRLLSARSSFPVLWDAEQSRGSIVLGMLRGVKLDEEAEAKKQKEKAEWNALRADIRRFKDGWSLYGLQGGIGALEKRLEKNLRQAGVEFRLGESVDKLDKDDRGLARVSGARRTVARADPSGAYIEEKRRAS